ncbi:uncharacterized protein LOC117104464, partial [Anneissia japonica]|uniref:uncharacterized protein LOC117104464 n=1 Tax=Anneissia japonica TaxID=1529436 RepID=UPI0014257504
MSLEREAQERSDVQAMGLSVFLQTYDFVATLYMLSDVLPLLSQLSKAMQRKDLDYTLVRPLVAGTISSVTALKTNPGQFFRQLPEVMVDLADKPMKFSIPTQDKTDSFKRSVYDKYLDLVVENLERRFPDLPMLEAFNIFNPGLLPESLDELNFYGQEEIKMLSEHYSLDDELLMEEWHTTKHLMKELPDCTCQAIMSRVGCQPEAFPNLARIVSAGLLIPTSTA